MTPGVGEDSPSLSIARLQASGQPQKMLGVISYVCLVLSLPRCSKLASAGDNILGSGFEQLRSGCSCILFFRTVVLPCGQSFRLVIKFPLAFNSGSCRADARIFPHDEESTSINCHVTVRTFMNKNFMEKVRSSWSQLSKMSGRQSARNDSLPCETDKNVN